MRLHQLLLVATTALSLTLAEASAQTLEGTVQNDPNSGLATYDFHFNGPPRGQAMLWISPWILPTPFPTPLGPLWLDPSLMFRGTGILPLDNSGQLDLSGSIPFDLSAGQPLVFQSLNIDDLGTLQFSQNAVALAQNIVQQPCQLNYAFSYDTQGSGFSAAGSGPAGASVEVQIVGPQGVRHTQSATIGQDGKFLIQGNVPGGLIERTMTS